MTHGLSAMTRNLADDHELYDRDYFAVRHYGLDEARRVMQAQERGRICERVPAGGNVLDIGCGIGDFVAAFDDRWTKYGIEPSEYAARLAMKLGVQMYAATNSLVPESMDCVIIRGSLQHMSSPLDTLREATYALKRGGLLAILATPDADSLVYKLWGNLPALDWPRNWAVLGSKCLANILLRLGYWQIETLHPYWDTPYARPLQDFGRFTLSLFAGYRPFAFPGNMCELYAIKH